MMLKGVKTQWFILLETEKTCKSFGQVIWIDWLVEREHHRSSVKHGRFLPFPFVQQYDSSLQNDSFVLAIL